MVLDWALEGGPNGAFTLRADLDQKHDEAIVIVGAMSTVKNRETATTVGLPGRATMSQLTLF